VGGSVGLLWQVFDLSLIFCTLTLSFIASFCASILLFDWMSFIDLMVSAFFLLFYLFSAATCAYIVKKLFEVTSAGSSQDPLDLLFIR